MDNRAIRYNQVLQASWPFKPDESQFLVVAPGRVNLIGEHVDHQGYGVCPCAIEQAVAMLVHVGSRKDTSAPFLRVEHLKPNTYNGDQFNDSRVDLKLSDAKKWTNYVCAAYLGVLEYTLNGQDAAKVGIMFDSRKGVAEDDFNRSQLSKLCISLFTDGDVPPAAGLSSSGALVVCSILALLDALQIHLDYTVVAELCARAERYGGVASGGMDQAAILLSESNQFLNIQFNPVRSFKVSLPQTVSIVVANTCRASPKAVKAAKMYNMRVFELKIGCLMLIGKEKASQVSNEELLSIQLKEVIEHRLKTTSQSILVKLDSLIPKKPLTKSEVNMIFSNNQREFLLTRLCGEKVWTDNDEFDINKRIKHVLSEALRVDDFVNTAGDNSLSDDEKSKRLGELMNASGLSLDEDFDCSCPEIRYLTKVARQCPGVHGSRQTGAGWGGCIVCLVDTSAVGSLIEKIENEYYEKAFNKEIFPDLEYLPINERVKANNNKDEIHKVWNQLVFGTVPAMHAQVYNDL